MSEVIEQIITVHSTVPHFSNSGDCSYPHIFILADEKGIKMLLKGQFEQKTSKSKTGKNKFKQFKNLKS